MKYFIAICDDRIHAKYIEDIIKKYEFYDEFCISKFYSSSSFLENIGEKFDIVVMDYDIDEMNGVELAQKLREVNQDTILVFLTGEISPQPIFFKLNTHRFLLKTYKEEELDDEIRSIIDFLREKRELKEIVLNCAGERRVFDLGKILYVSKIKRGAEIFLYD